MLKSKVPDIFGKTNQIVVHSALSVLPTVQNNPEIL